MNDKSRRQWTWLIAISALGGSNVLLLRVTNAVSQTVPNLPTIAPKSDVDQLLNQGQVKFEQLDYGGAIAAFNRAVLSAPNRAEPYLYRGLVRFELSDRLGALRDFDDAVQRDPRSAQAYLHRASALFSLGSETEAIVDLQLAAQLFADQGDQAGYQRAVSLLKHFNPAIAP